MSVWVEAADAVPSSHRVSYTIPCCQIPLYHIDAPYCSTWWGDNNEGGDDGGWYFLVSLGPSGPCHADQTSDPQEQRLTSPHNTVTQPFRLTDPPNKNPWSKRWWIKYSLNLCPIWFGFFMCCICGHTLLMRTIISVHTEDKGYKMWVYWVYSLCQPGAAITPHALSHTSFFPVSASFLFLFFYALLRIPSGPAIILFV